MKAMGVALLCAVVLAGQSAVAQTPARATDPPAVTASLEALNRLTARVARRPFVGGIQAPPVNPALAAAKQRVQTTLERLQQLSTNWPAESPVDYRANLDATVAAFDRALSAANTTQMTAFLNALGDDLEVKLEHCTMSGGKLGGSVVVSVRTVDGDHESRNWQVFYVPKVFEASGTITPDRFPKLSSPTSETLVPGRYVMWVRDANNRTSEKVTVRVGEGKRELPLELIVPGGSSR